MTLRADWMRGRAELLWNHVVPTAAQEPLAAALANPYKMPAGMALAAVLIAVGDVEARSPERIASDLVDRGVCAEPPAIDVIRHVVSHFRTEGVPGPRPWAVGRAFAEAVDLWVANATGSMPQGDVVAGLTRLTRRPAADAARLLGPHEDELPTPALEEAIDPTTAVADATGLPWVDRLRSAAALWAGTSEPMRSILARDLRALTAHEIELFEDEAVDPYLAWAMAPINASVRIPLLLPDAMPTADDRGQLAPEWMEDAIVRGGGRMLNEWLAPYAVWVATAETPEHLVRFEEFAAGDSIALGLNDDESTVHIDIMLGVGNDSLRVPYSYDTGYPAGAWELVHLAAARRIRFVLMRMLEDEPLTVLSVRSIHLDDALADRLLATGLERLRSHVQDDRSALVAAIQNVPSAAEMSSTTLAFVDNARAEELLIDLVAEERSTWPRWSELAIARRQLAQARADRVANWPEGREVAELAAIAEGERVAHVALERAFGENPLRNATHPLHRAAEIAEWLPPDTAAVELYEKDGYLGALVLEHGSPHVQPIDLSDLPLRELRSVVKVWADEPDGRLEELGHSREQILEHLCEDLQGVADAICECIDPTTTRLLVVPTAPFDLLPVHAIFTGNGLTMADRFVEIAYLPSLEVGQHLGRSARPTRSPLLVAHSGAGHRDYSPLDGPAIEVAALARIHRSSRAITEDEAAPTDVIAEACGRSLLHIASHGVAEVNRWASGLLLSGPSTGAATLSAAAIRANATDMPSIVVLSACRTGGHEHRVRSLETARGLDASFLATGSAAVVSTLWEIDDIAAVVFSIVLHVRLAEGATIGAAVAHGVDVLRNQDDDSKHPGVIAALDSELPAWREDLASVSSSAPSIWAAFRLLGLPNLTLR